MKMKTRDRALNYLPAITLLLLGSLVASASEKTDSLSLQTRSRVKLPHDGGRLAVIEKTVHWDPHQTAIIIVDMWDNHHCEGAARRVAELAQKMNEVLEAARSRGILIIHSPADCVGFYQETVQRKAAKDAPFVQAPVPFAWHDRDPKIELTYPDELTRDGTIEGTGCCSGCETSTCLTRNRAWTRQIATIEIGESDAISEDGQEVYNLLKQRGIQHVILMGVHTNLCVLGRPFGIRQMKYLGIDTVLCRDMTDSFFEPKNRQTSHFRGTELIIEHIEHYWCPTITSTSLTDRAPFRFRKDVAQPGSKPSK